MQNLLRSSTGCTTCPTNRTRPTSFLHLFEMTRMLTLIDLNTLDAEFHTDKEAWPRMSYVSMLGWNTVYAYDRHMKCTVADSAYRCMADSTSTRRGAARRWRRVEGAMSICGRAESRHHSRIQARLRCSRRQVGSGRRSGHGTGSGLSPSPRAQCCERAH